MRTASSTTTIAFRRGRRDEDRETLIRQAVAEGANTIVCVGYLYGPALAWGATEYPDVHFIAVDVNGFDINSENGTIPENVFCVTFKEEEAGYLAGYAAVKDGFTKLGFLGGMAVPPLSAMVTAMFRALMLQHRSWALTFR